MTSASAETLLSPSLIEQAEAVAYEMKISPNQLLVRAVEDFIERYRRNRRLMEEMNQVYEAGPDQEEREWLQLSQQAYRKVLEQDGEW
ncbi:MAG TPA: hypothetical protein PLD20_35375 [Blastocatellia bacterium]|nr:hypothetical protein [Blastocatellia bacterium]HMV86213.1 hypothetical protein [Blastocatellia bacterium]HMX28843.1 hypothetical protein [Blastocatellia bacterium]HMY73754.1 hypothetical protein [Blastocatellia bacterium]HMZ23259.1 hypothetical protein [Blastocatellia bacterium]